MANESQPQSTAITNQVQPNETKGAALTPAEAAQQQQDALTGKTAAAEAQQAAAGKKQVAPKAPAAPQKNLKKLKLKVDGQEIEQEFDMNDEEAIREELQMARVARKRMQEYSELQKEVVKFVEDLKKNPRKALSNPTIGVDVKELAARIIEEEIAESRKSPEQLEREKLQEELTRMKEERDREKNEDNARQMERLREQEFERIDIQIDQALSTTDLPKEPYVVKKIAEYMLLGFQEGKDVSPADVLPLVRDEILSDIRHLAEVLPEDTLQEIFGDVIKKVRKANVAKAKQKVAVGSNRPADVAKKAAEATQSTAKKKTFKEFFGV
jgi:hypothetical protein